ncbi:MAG: hypothetical protein CMJ70_10210 [Planctomycetaceae bacterium]|nr:hypothetical protein [Planctomycetaceae bacterium]
MLLTACATIAVFVFSETRARHLGYEPTHPWLPGMWTRLRFQLETLPDDHTVLLGASRIPFGIHLDNWESRTGTRPLILAWPGAPFGPLLTDRAQHTTFYVEPRSVISRPASSSPLRQLHVSPRPA